MEILILLIIEIITISGSMVIKIKGIIDSVLEIANKGYKISNNKLNELLKEPKDSTFKKKLNKILLFIPGLNLIASKITSINSKKKIFNRAKEKKLLIKMTEEELKQYNTLQNKSSKFVYVTTISSLKEDEKVKVIDNKLAIVKTKGLISLDYDRLLPLSYTLEEVKKLNNVTKMNYKLGKINGINVAIIGIPNPNILINKVQFKSENYKNKYAFNQLDYEENKDNRFIIYPYTDKFDNDLENCIEKIRYNRANKKQKVNILQNNNIITTKENNLILKKTLKRKVINKNKY